MSQDHTYEPALIKQEEDIEAFSPPYTAFFPTDVSTVAFVQPSYAHTGLMPYTFTIPSGKEAPVTIATDGLAAAARPTLGIDGEVPWGCCGMQPRSYEFVNNPLLDDNAFTSNAATAVSVANKEAHAGRRMPSTGPDSVSHRSAPAEKRPVERIMPPGVEYDIVYEMMQVTLERCSTPSGPDPSHPLLFHD